MTYALEVLAIPKTEYNKMDAEYLRGYRQILGLKTTYGQSQDGEDMTNTNDKIIELVNEALSRTKKQRKFCPLSAIIKARAQKKFGDSLRRDWRDPIGQVTRGIHRTRERPWNFTAKGECLPWGPKTNWIVETAKRAWEQYRLWEKLPVRYQRYGQGSNKERRTGKNIGDTKAFHWQQVTHVRILLEAADDHRF